MKPQEYETMAVLEGEHWWYRGLRDAIAKTLQRKRFALPERPNVLDAGCGTGANLRLLGELLAPGYLGGFDFNPRAVEWAKSKVPEADIYFGDLRDPELRVEGLDLILSCDVISSPGTAAVFGGLVRLVKHMRDGGLMILNLAAYDWMFSEHDVAVHISERYTARKIRRLFGDLGLSVELLSYRCCFLFPAIVLARLPSILGRKPTPEEAISDVRPSGKLTTALLTRILKAENTLMASGIPLPWGSSIFAVGRKK